MTTPEAPSASADPDPLPVAPSPPDFELCCGSGCERCVFDVHDLAMDAWRQAVRAWRARHPEAG